MTKYLATIGLNKRDVQTLSPKVVLRGVINQDTNEQFRDHCWVSITSAVNAAIPTSNREEYVIEFEAEEREYYKGQKALINLQNIAIVGQHRKKPIAKKRLK